MICTMKGNTHIVFKAYNMYKIKRIQSTHTPTYIERQTINEQYEN